MDNSPNSTRKRQSNKSVSKLEEEVGYIQATSSRSRSKKEFSITDEQEQKLFDSLRELENLLGPQNCCLCDRNISKSVKVRCIECPSPALTICLECHRTGAENEQHKKSHDYYILDNLNFPLFTKDWTAKEELLLI